MALMQRRALVNLQEFKARLVKILGPAKESLYCNLLSRFLSLRLSKEELDRLVLSTIGKENVVLHNSFVRAIFNNATCGEAPPPPASLPDISKPLKGVRRKATTSSGGVDEGPTSAAAAGAQLQGGRSNGDGFAGSSRKGRSGIRDRKGAERPSPLGSSRADTSTAMDDDVARMVENGHGGGPDLLRPVQCSQYGAEQPETWQGSHPAKRARYEEDGESEGEEAGGDAEAEEEDEDVGTMWLTRSNVSVPLGIPFCRPSAGGARMAAAAAMPPGLVTLSKLGYGVDDDDGCSDSMLPSTESIRQRVQMGGCLESGLESCDASSAEVIRLGLETHLLRIIKYVVELNRAKRGSHREGSGKENGNGSWWGHMEKAGSQERGGNEWNHHVTTGRERGLGGEEQEQERATVSALDFYVAMDLDRSKLGMNWSMLLEKALLRVVWEQ